MPQRATGAVISTGLIVTTIEKVQKRDTNQVKKIVIWATLKDRSELPTPRYRWHQGWRRYDQSLKILRGIYDSEIGGDVAYCNFPKTLQQEVIH